MKKIILLAMILCLFKISSCQDYIDALSLPRPDCSGKNWNSFYDNENKIMVLSDLYKDDAEYRRMYGFFLLDSGLVSKKESELTEDDYKRPLLIFGPVQGFKNWEKFDVPVKKLENGFEFMNNQYSGENDGINYISDYRMIYTGNSLLPVWELESTPSGLYQYVIDQNSQRTIVGNFLPGNSFEIDLISIRNNNYNEINTKDFKLYVSKKIDPGLVAKRILEIDSIAPGIYSQFNIKPLSQPIICYVHSEPNEASLFANFFFMTGCDALPEDMTFGTVHMKQLHSVGFNTDIIRHEGFHSIWEKSVGLSINSFFSEGIQEYYNWGHDNFKVNNNITIIQKHLDYDMTDLVKKGDSQAFWGGPSENNWPIAYPLSGLFVKYLVDNRGLELFKKFYVIEDKNIASKEIYGKSVDELIMDFRNNVLLN